MELLGECAVKDVTVRSCCIYLFDGFVKHDCIWSVVVDILICYYEPVIVQFMTTDCCTYLYYSVGFPCDRPHLIANSSQTMLAA